MLSLQGSAAITIEAAVLYLDAGATAFDNYDGNVTDSVVIPQVCELGINLCHG